MRQLTPEEDLAIKEAKRKANAVLQGIRSDFTHQIKQLQTGQRGYVTEEVRTLRRKRDLVPRATGKPVFINFDGLGTILLDYVKAKKALRMTGSRYLRRSIKVVKEGDRKALVIDYEGANTGTRGTMELYELPDNPYGRMGRYLGLPTVTYWGADK